MNPQQQLCSPETKIITVVCEKNHKLYDFSVKSGGIIKYYVPICYVIFL